MSQSVVFIIVLNNEIIYHTHESMFATAQAASLSITSLTACSLLWFLRMTDLMSFNCISSIDWDGLRIETRGIFSASAKSSILSATDWDSNGTANHSGSILAKLALNYSSVRSQLTTRTWNLGVLASLFASLIKSVNGYTNFWHGGAYSAVKSTTTWAVCVRTMASSTLIFS